MQRQSKGQLLPDKTCPQKVGSCAPVASVCVCNDMHKCRIFRLAFFESGEDNAQLALNVGPERKSTPPLPLAERRGEGGEVPELEKPNMAENMAAVAGLNPKQAVRRLVEKGLGSMSWTSMRRLAENWLLWLYYHYCWAALGPNSTSRAARPSVSVSPTRLGETEGRVRRLLPLAAGSMRSARDHSAASQSTAHTTSLCSGLHTCWPRPIHPVYTFPIKAVCPDSTRSARRRATGRVASLKRRSQRASLAASLRGRAAEEACWSVSLCDTLVCRLSRLDALGSATRRWPAGQSAFVILLCTFSCSSFELYQMSMPVAA